MSEYGFYLVVINAHSKYPMNYFYFWKHNEMVKLEKLAALDFKRYIEEGIAVGADLVEDALQTAEKIDIHKLQSSQPFMYEAALNAINQ